MKIEESSARRNNNNELANVVSHDDDMMHAIQAAAGLLRDVEATLRAIEQDEADEIADVALTVAHLFLASLQSVHASLTPRRLGGGGHTAAGEECFSCRTFLSH